MARMRPGHCPRTNPDIPDISGVRYPDGHGHTPLGVSGVRGPVRMSCPMSGVLPPGEAFR